MTMIKNNITAILSQIREFERRYQRQPHSVSLLAASKKQSIANIQSAIDAGQLAFGENYLQEALVKITALADKNLEWHFIGPIQRNKTRKIAEHFHWVHSVDDINIAKRLNEQRPDHLPPLNICIEVNVSLEASKSGVHLNDLKDLAHYCQSLPRLKLRGLMAIPAHKEHFIAQSSEFHKLRASDEIMRSHGIVLDTLSIGMSHDMEAAIAEGATIVRIGTSIFGPRD